MEEWNLFLSRPVYTAQLTLLIILTLKATVQHSLPFTVYIQMHCKQSTFFDCFVVVDASVVCVGVHMHMSLQLLSVELEEP